MIANFATFCNEDYYAGAAAADANQKLGRKLAVAKSLQAKGVDAEEIRQTTGWFTGISDKKWRYELAERITLTPAQMRKDYSKEGVQYGVFQLSDIIKDQLFFKAYPTLRYADVHLSCGEGLEEQGSYQEGQPATDQYYGYSDQFRAQGPTFDLMVDSLVHEIQHAVQNREGFAAGASPSDFRYSYDSEGRETKRTPEEAFQKYLADPGEVEARDVATRFRLSSEERRAQKPYTTGR